MSLHWIGLYAAITVITTGRIQKESITASKKQKRHWNRCLRKDIGNDSHCFCWQQHIQFPLVCLQSYAVWMCKDAEGTCNILAHPNSIRYDDLLRGSRNTLSRKSLSMFSSYSCIIIIYKLLIFSKFNKSIDVFPN